MCHYHHQKHINIKPPSTSPVTHRGHPRSRVFTILHLHEWSVDARAPHRQVDGVLRPASLLTAQGGNQRLGLGDHKDATRNKKLLGTPGIAIATRSKDATRGYTRRSIRKLGKGATWLSPVVDVNQVWDDGLLDVVEKGPAAVVILVSQCFLVFCLLFFGWMLLVKMSSSADD